MDTMEDQTPQSSGFHRRNNYSIRRKPLHDENTRSSGSEEEHHSHPPELSAPASDEESEQLTPASQDTGIKTVLKAIWSFLNTPIVANAFFAFFLLQSTIHIMDQRQAARNADQDKEHMALLVAFNTLRNQVNYLTENMEAMAKKLEEL
jgi:hypothetical protein